MDRQLAIGTVISLILHGILAYWAAGLVVTHTMPPPDPKKLVRAVNQQIVLPKKELPKIEPPKIEPKPEPAAQAPSETPQPAQKPSAQPKNQAPKQADQKPAEPAPLVLSKTYGASDGSGVSVNAGKDDTLGDPNVDPNEKNTRQRFVPKVEAPVASDDTGDGDGPATRKVEIVHAVPKSRCRVEWPDGAEGSGRVVEVTLSLEIGLDGSIDKLRILRGAGDPFDDAAMAAIRQCAFSPGTRDGKPFRDRIPFVVEFKPSR